MLLHRLQVRLQEWRAAVAARQGLEAAELLDELGRAVGAGLLQVVDAEKAIVVQGGLPELGL